MENTSLSNLASETIDENSWKEKFKGYPAKDNKRERLRFTLNTFGRAISESEFEEVIKLMEGDNASETLAAFQRTLRGLTHPRTGEIMQFQFANDKTRFYIWPKWQGIDKVSVITEHLPVPNELNQLNEEILKNPICVFKSVE